MVRPNINNKKPLNQLYDMYRMELPMMPPQEVPRPEPPPRTPSPIFTPSLRFLTIRRSRMHKISRGLLHVHKNGLRTREPTCPANTTCVGIDDIGEYMYNQARKCKHLMDEVNRMKDPKKQHPLANKTPAAAELNTGEPGEAQLNVVMELRSPPPEDVTQQNCWDAAPTTTSP